MSDSVTPEPDIFPVGSLVGSYRILQRLGAGAMGAVYLVDDTILQRTAALKTINANLLDDADQRTTWLARFRAEAKAAANIRHPNIIEVFAAGEHQGNAYYVMEYVPESETLKARLKRFTVEGTFLPVEEIKAYFLQAAAALRAIHKTGVIHRDIKLDNLLTYQTPEGPRLKILDFGVVHLPSSDLTRTQQILGTPRYFAPECVDQFFGAKVRTDHRADLFALGVALYMSLTGKRPFDGTCDSELYTAIQHHHPPLPSSIRPDLPLGWDRVTMTLLEKKPERRYPDAGAVYDDLMRVETLGAYVRRTEDETNPERPAALPPDPLAKNLPAVAVVDDMSMGASPEGEVGENDAREAPHAMPKLGDDAGRFVQALGQPEAQLKRLPLRVRLAVGAAAAVILILVLVVAMSTRNSKRTALESVEPIVDASDAEAKTKPVTPEELLRDEQEARRRQLITKADAPMGSLTGRATTDPDASPTPEDLAPGRKHSGATHLAGKTTPMPGSSTRAPTQTPATKTEAGPRRRKDVGAIISYFDPVKSEDANNPAAPPKRLGIVSATRVAAKLEARLSNSAMSTPAIAVLAEPIKRPDGSVAVLPSSRVMGRAAHKVINDTTARVEISFTKLILPNGTEHGIRAVAVMSDGSAGIIARMTKQDGRTASNLAEAALDGAQVLLSDKPGNSASDRFLDDERSDAREKRKEQVLITLPKNVVLFVLFSEAA